MLSHHGFTEFEGNIIIAGDLNVVERDHAPRYAIFGEWEYRFYEAFAHHRFLDAFRLAHPGELDYSWFGRKQCGYRFDHFFVSHQLARQVEDCLYLHETRKLALSDHSGMLLVLRCAPALAL